MNFICCNVLKTAFPHHDPQNRDQVGQLVRCLSVGRYDNMKPILSSHIVDWEKRLLQDLLCPPHRCCGMHTHMHMCPAQICGIHLHMCIRRYIILGFYGQSWWGDRIGLYLYMCYPILQSTSWTSFYPRTKFPTFTQDLAGCFKSHHWGGSYQETTRRHQSSQIHTYIYIS